MREKLKPKVVVILQIHLVIHFLLIGVEISFESSIGRKLSFKLLIFFSNFITTERLFVVEKTFKIVALQLTEFTEYHRRLLQILRF